MQPADDSRCSRPVRDGDRDERARVGEGTDGRRDDRPRKLHRRRRVRHARRNEGVREETLRASWNVNKMYEATISASW